MQAGGNNRRQMMRIVNPDSGKTGRGCAGQAGAGILEDEAVIHAQPIPHQQKGFGMRFVVRAIVGQTNAWKHESTFASRSMGSTSDRRELVTSPIRNPRRPCSIETVSSGIGRVPRTPAPDDLAVSIHLILHDGEKRGVGPQLGQLREHLLVCYATAETAILVPAEVDMMRGQ